MKKFLCIFLSAALLFGVSGCGSLTNTGKGAMIGTGGGAAVGAGLGAIFGKGKGAAIGAAVGAALPEPMRTSAGFFVTGLSGKILIHTLPNLLQ